MSRVRTTCEAKNCNNTSSSKNYCASHYKIFQKGKNPDAVEVVQKEKCSVPSCEYTIVSLTYCALHYKRYSAKSVEGLDIVLNRDLPCVYDGCQNLRHRGEWCNTHSLRIERYGDPDVCLVAKRPKFCIVDGCDKKHSAMNYCRLHYKRSLVYAPDSPEFLSKERNKRVTVLCSVSDCSRTTYAGKYCSMHNRRYLKYGDPNIGAAIRNDPVCKIESCLKSTKGGARNMCPMHYERFKKFGDPNFVTPTLEFCKLSDCDNKHKALGYCQKHYKKFTIYGDPYGSHIYKSDIGTKPCSIEDCSNMNYVRGWCNVHYTRWLNYGDPLFTVHSTKEKETLLYRIFNSDGEIIYIGITCCYEIRMRGHKDSKFWWNEVDSIKTRKYPNRTKALEAEKRAIKKYNPVYNIIHNKKAA